MARARTRATAKGRFRSCLAGARAGLGNNQVYGERPGFQIKGGSVLMDAGPVNSKNGTAASSREFVGFAKGLRVRGGMAAVVVNPCKYVCKMQS